MFDDEDEDADYEINDDEEEEEYFEDEAEEGVTEGLQMTDTVDAKNQHTEIRKHRSPSFKI